jgi:hypothetical protein
VKGAPYDAAAFVLGEFSIELIKEEELEACAEIDLYLTTETVKDRGATRAKVVTYDIPSKDDSALTIELPAHYVESSKNRNNCPVKTIAQYYDVSSGEWADVHNSDWRTLHMEADQLYIALSMTQRQYIEEVAPYMMGPNTVYDANGLPKWVAIECRYRTWAVADPLNVIDDPFTLNITSSGESRVDYCADEFAGLTMSGEMKNREYRISDDDFHAEVRSYFLQTKFEGQLSDACQHEYYMALETQLPSQKWKVVWSEWEYARSEHVWVERNETTGRYEMKVAISHHDFERHTQLEYGQVVKELTVQMKVSLRSSKGQPIPGMEATFALAIKDNDKVSECLAATVALATQVRQEF